MDSLVTRWVGRASRILGCYCVWWGGTPPRLAARDCQAHYLAAAQLSDCSTGSCAVDSSCPCSLSVAPQRVCECTHPESLRDPPVGYYHHLQTKNYLVKNIQVIIYFVVNNYHLQWILKLLFLCKFWAILE